MRWMFLVLASSAPAVAAPPEECDAGDSSVLARMPAPEATAQPTGPTYPEGIAVIGDRVIVSGPANFGTAGNGSPSQLTVFDRDSGELRAEVPLVGEDLAQEHALSELAAWGPYAYSPSTQLGVVRWRFSGTDTPAQEVVSTPFCSVTIPFPCLTVTDACPADIRPYLPPLPNGIAVDDGGTVYVADSLQGIIWRVDPAGVSAPAEPEVFVCSRALQGAGESGLELFGANGLALVGDDLYVGVAFGPVAGGAPTSAIYRVALDDPDTLDLVYSFSAVEVAPGVWVPPIADGLAYDALSGNLFVVLAGHDAVAELDLDAGVEVARYTRTDADMPFYAPAGIALDDGAALVTNHAITCCLDGDANPACTCFGADELFGVVEVCLE